MRLLHIITGLSIGGAERALYNILAAGLGKQNETAVISLQDAGKIGPRIQELGVPIYALHMRRGIPTPGSFMRLRRIVRELRPDIIQGWMYHGNLAASVAARLSESGRPVVAWNIRQTLYDLKSEKSLTRQVIRANRALSGRAAAIIYNSHLSRHQHEAFGFAGSRGIVIPNGFDLTRLRPDSDRGAALRRELGLSEGVLVIGHVARFHPMKDHASFLRAAKRVACENSFVRFLLVGREVSLGNPALAGIVPPDLLERFVFLGERSDVHRLMQAMDLLATSSAWGEGFPNVLGEAMACGVPCVTTDVGDSADIVGDSGIVVPASDSGALANGLLEILNKSHEERRALGQRARARIEANYAVSRIVSQYAETYESLGAYHAHNERGELDEQR